MHSKKMKTKDFILLGLTAAIYIMFYFAFIMIGYMFSLITSIITNLVFQLFIGGVIMVFILNKIPKFGILTTFILVFILFYTLIGNAYLPWFSSLIVFTLCADLLAYSSNYKNKFKNAIAYGLINVGNMLGAIIPIWFFADEFVKEWVSRGMSEQDMQLQLLVYGGWSGAVVLLANFLCSAIGVYIGYKILSKHFVNQQS